MKCEFCHKDIITEENNIPSNFFVSFVLRRTKDVKQSDKYPYLPGHNPPDQATLNFHSMCFEEIAGQEYVMKFEEYFLEKNKNTSKLLEDISALKETAIENAKNILYNLTCSVYGCGKAVDPGSHLCRNCLDEIKEDYFK